MANLQLQSPGYNALAQRIIRPLAATKAFSLAALVGLDAAGKATPFLTGTVAGIQYAVGILDPAYNSGSNFTSGATDEAPVLSGCFSMVNGTSSNALVQADAQAPVYTADGLTANKTNSANPLPVSGTTTGKFLGTFLGFDPNVNGNVLISVVPEIDAAAADNGGMLPVPVADGGTGAADAAGARTNLAAAHAGVATGADGTEASGSTTPTFAGSSVTPVPGAAVTGLTGTSTGQVVTLTTSGVTLNQYKGGFLFDGVSLLLILSNTATNTGTTTFTVFGPAPAATITGVGQIVPVGVTAAGAVGAHTHTGPSHTHTQT